MKVLLYIPRIDAKSGGVGSFISLLARDLGKLCELHIVSHKFEDELPLEESKVHYISSCFFPYTTAKRQYLQLLREISPDLCHINTCWAPLCSLITFWSKNEGYKVVYSPHGMLEPYAIKRHYFTKKLPAILLYQKRSIAMSDVIHVTALSEKKSIQTLKWNQNIEVVPNCIQIEKTRIKKTWQRTHTILFLSRIHPKKGIHYLIESLACLKNRLRGYKCLIVGPSEGSYLAELQKMVRDLDLLDIVKFQEPVYDSSKWDLYRSADVFVLPTESENFGIVIAESLASGTPVITTVGTPWDALETHHCGWFTQIGSQPTTEALQKFLDCSEEELEIMGKNGRKLVEDNFTSEAVAMQMFNMYHNTIS